MPFVLGLLVVAVASSVARAGCETPTWASPAYSAGGTFRGELVMACDVEARDLERLKESLSTEIVSRGTVHAGPLPSDDGVSAGHAWEVTHPLGEAGVVGRLRAELLSSPNVVVYRTRTHEVRAEGLAGYLRGVAFKVEVREERSRWKIEFRNSVEVERPWFAPKILFDPMARGICLEKMKEIETKLLPWMISASMAR